MIMAEPGGVDIIRVVAMDEPYATYNDDKYFDNHDGGDDTDDDTGDETEDDTDDDTDDDNDYKKDTYAAAGAGCWSVEHV